MFVSHFQFRSDINRSHIRVEHALDTPPLVCQSTYDIRLHNISGCSHCLSHRRACRDRPNVERSTIIGRRIDLFHCTIFIRGTKPRLQKLPFSQPAQPIPSSSASSSTATATTTRPDLAHWSTRWSECGPVHCKRLRRSNITNCTADGDVAVQNRQCSFLDFRSPLGQRLLGGQLE